VPWFIGGFLEDVELRLCCRKKFVELFGEAALLDHCFTASSCVVSAVANFPEVSFLVPRLSLTGAASSAVGASISSEDTLALDAAVH
jgi:hypothetical protein